LFAAKQASTKKMYKYLDKDSNYSEDNMPTIEMKSQKQDVTINGKVYEMRALITPAPEHGLFREKRMLCYAIRPEAHEDKRITLEDAWAIAKSQVAKIMALEILPPKTAAKMGANPGSSRAFSNAFPFTERCPVFDSKSNKNDKVSVLTFGGDGRFNYAVNVGPNDAFSVVVLRSRISIGAEIPAPRSVFIYAQLDAAKENGELDETTVNSIARLIRA
jgi:hypothetical protein